VGQKSVAVLLLTGLLAGFAPFYGLRHAAAHSGGSEIRQIVDGEVTQKFVNSPNCSYPIAVDGWRYLIPADIYYRVTVGWSVRLNGTNWITVS
jgi:hypothetical protein